MGRPMLELATIDVRLLLDANISPNIVPRFWENGIDAVALRDRAKLRVTDHQVLAFAQKENRAVATINLYDFEKLIAGMETHAGVISFPSGGSRDEQFDYIMAAVQQLRATGSAMRAAKDGLIAVSEDFKVTRRTVVKAKAPVISLVAKPSA
jgi:predicted nuclease of predicted toxin-antitoxin system